MVQFIRPLVLRLAREQNHRCIWCGFQVAMDIQDARQIIKLENSDNLEYYRRKVAKKIIATFEHLEPRSRGGTFAIDNGACACWWCNMWRGNEDQWTFAGRVTAIVAVGQHPRQVYRATGFWPPRFPVKELIDAPRTMD